MRILLFLSIAAMNLTWPALAQDFLPRIVPPSPEAASMAKYGDIPVNLYNGLPGITIPLYEISVRDINLAVSLSYHASGIRVEEEAGWVGLGWDLNAGGVITRTVNGNDDFLYSPDHNYRGYIYSYDFFVNDTDPEKIYNYLHLTCLRELDLQPDIFYFNFSGYSGKFYLRQKHAPGDKVTAILLSPEKMRIEYDEANGIWNFTAIDGFRYVFAEKEYTENWTGSGETRLSAIAGLTPPSTEPVNHEFISSWYLTEITSPGGEKITFRYKHADENSREFASVSIVRINESVSQCIGIGKLGFLGGCLADSPFENYGIISMSPGYNAPIDLACATKYITDWDAGSPDMDKYSNTYRGCDNQWSFSASKQVHRQVYLQSIIYSGGHLEFHTASRQDIEEHGNDDRRPGTIFSKPQYLDKINVYNTRRKLQTIEFKYSYFNNDRDDDPFRFKRLKLISVQKMNNQETIPPWFFEYAENIRLPSKESGSRDHWGFYNNALNANAAGQSTTIPSMAVTEGEKIVEDFRCANREADENYARVGILERITYPTGGYTHYIYENHSFNIDQAEYSRPFKPWVLTSFDKNTVFDLKYGTDVTFNIELKCRSMACYPNGTEIPCSIPDINHPYFTLTDLASGHEITKGLYADFQCALDPSNAWCLNQSIVPEGDGTMPCGITRKINFSLGPGKYLVKNDPINNIQVNITISFLQPENVIVQNYSRIVHGGGLRIKSVLTHDGIDHDNDIYKEYTYEFQDSLGVLRSSGKLMSFPKYAYGEFYITNELDGSHIALIKLKSFSYSNVPLGSSAQSSPVGYDKVVEKTGRLGSSGYTEYYYTNLPDTEPEPFFPNSPTTSNAAGNGLLLRRVDRNNNHFKVAETLNEYNSEYISMVRGCDILAYSCGSLEMFLTGNYQYVFKNYILQSRWWFKTRSEERTYDLADTSNRRYLSLQYSYRYNPDHKLVIGADMINSEGERVSHHTFYPLDATQLAPGEMWNERDPDYKHLHSYPIRELTTITKGQATEIVLEKINHFQYDTSTSRIILTQVAAANNGQPPETKVRFTKHDAKSNFIEYIKYGRNESEEIVTSVLWSYHQALPVAIIENASFSEVSGAAVKCGVNLLELSNMTDELMILDNLLLIRKELPAARMNIYTYEESVGITSITDPNGKKTYYQYDDLQRLKTVNDFEGNKVNEYEYGYQTMTIKK